MARYELKCWTEPFQAIWEGHCTHTVRRMARPYAAGDTLLLREYDPRRPQHYAEDRYTGRSLVVNVTYVSAPGSFGLPDDLCVMSIVRHSRLVEGDRRLPPSIDPVVSP